MRRLLAALVLLACASSGFAADSYNVAYGATTTVNEHGSSRKVTNNHASTRAIFVATKTSTEWSSFRAGTPSGVSLASSDTLTIFLTSGSSWTVPSDWNNAANTIECIGGGAGGRSSGVNAAGPGGGGGGYSKKTNLALTPGAGASYQIGTGGAASTSGGDTWFNGASLGASSCGAQGGTTGAASLTGGAGGAAGSG